MHLPFFAAVFALKPSFKYGELTSQQAGGGAGKTNYMWYKLGQWVLKYRVALLILLLAASGFMAWQASKVQLSYEFTKAIPSNNPKYQEYLAFKAQFGEDGNVLVVGVQDSAFFAQAHMQAYRQALQLARQVPGVAGVLAVPMAVNLYRADTADKLLAAPIFTDSLQSQPAYDSARTLFENLLFYKGLLYNPNSKAYLALLTIQKEVLASKARTQVVAGVQQAFAAYQQATGVEVRYSGLPYIRTRVADRVKAEMYWFLIGSLALATITLILFFRSVSATLISLVVVALGVIWAVGTMHLLGYQITLLNALIPPLMIVIGIPNCIYFLNKYHMSWEDIQGQAGAAATPNAAQLKRQAILNMVGKMGVVTLFCNIAAAVGFAVFALTESALLKEFGAVAGIGIMAIFVISFILIPAALSYLPPPKERHTRYLRNRFLENLLVKVEYWVLQHRKMVYLITAVVLVAAIAGILRLQSVGFIVDDLPKKDKIYTDLKWFEQNFGGVMPLEIVVDARKKNGITRNLQTIQRIDELSAYLDSLPQTARPLSLLEGLKFAKQAYYDGDSLSYMVPNEFDMAFLAPYLRGDSRSGTPDTSQMAKLTRSFMDSTRQRARVSVNMADVGTLQMATLLQGMEQRTTQIFDTAHYNVQFTGSTVTFLEGSKFIINGLKESIIWAFVLIALTMLYLFRSWRILICSLVPNLIPLVVTAGVMGWAGVPLKPSTVLVFSVALGIAIDVTIRFLVNYKQELPAQHQNVLGTTTATIRNAGISILYTSLVLVAGFVIFMFSSFGGTFALGWLTSFTLLVATATNLVFLPVMMLGVLKGQ